ncbi:DUF3298 and DUF4163 domain-containing protein [Peptococcaceae bacterium 1198_IL3148]
MRKIAMIVLLAVLITTAGCGAKAGENVQNVTSEEVITQKQHQVTIVAKEENLKNEFIEVKLRIPQISDMQNEAAQKQLNNQFNSVYQLRDSMQKEAEQTAEDLKQSGFPFRPYELIADYDISYNQQGILSLTTTVYTYTGGAHGGTAKTTYNVDINSGEQISLKSMFKEGVNYKDLINQEISNQIAKEPEIYFSGDMGFKTIADDQNFYITEGKIVVYFSQYEIAPYASGIPEFELQLSQFKDSLKPEYQAI